MIMYEFINFNLNQVNLLGSDRIVYSFDPGERKVLPEYFKRYVPRYLKIIGEVHGVRQSEPAQLQPSKLKLLKFQSKSGLAENQRYNTIKNSKKISKPVFPRQSKANSRSVHNVDVRDYGKSEFNKNKLGHTKLTSTDADKFYRSHISTLSHSISNDVGVGILSYNRLDSLKRLVSSIIKYTNLKRTTVFISDESSNDDVKKFIRELRDIVIIDNSERLGVAGNTNRLIKCLSRFRYKLILNDDVEILRPGWDIFYFDAMQATNYHHFCMQQIGLLNASIDSETNINNYTILTKNEKPHGAILAYDSLVDKKVGYFDEEFGLYGMEHVDWSDRVSYSGMQLKGYHDVAGSNKYFKIHNDQSTVSNKGSLLNESKKIYADKHSNKNRIYVGQSRNLNLPSVSYIIPFRDSGDLRNGAIKLVLQNIKAQRFPVIDIILVEQDNKKKISIPELESINYILANTTVPQPFTKGIAFNTGWANALYDKIILHDADMLVHDNYSTIMYDLISKHKCAHIGANVLYLSKESTDYVIEIEELSDQCSTVRTVGYFEGGSLGCDSKTYADIGGFNENFIGYGCEDCEFFERLSSITTFYNKRSENLIHLHHSRTEGWDQCHEKNKILHASLKALDMSTRTSQLSNYLLKKYNRVVKS